MDIENKINESIKDSMKSKDAIRLESLRAIKSAILLEKTKTRAKDQVEDEIILKILQKMVKQRNDSAKIYIEQEREELAGIEISQAKIISEFLPEQLSELEIEKIVIDTINKIRAQGMKDMGKVMGVLSGKLAGKADGKTISSIVRQKLS